MADLIERLEEYNKDWRTRASSAKEVAEAIAEIKRLRSELQRRDEVTAELQFWNSKSR